MLAPLRWNRCLHFRTSLISSHLHSQLSPSSDSQQNPTSNADHVHIRRNNTERMQVVRWNRAIMDHMRSGRCDSARRIFDSMPYQDTVSYNSMMSGYLSSGRLDLAVDLFRRNPNKDVVSYNTMLKGYVCFNDLSSARKLFRDMPLKDVVSWNTMISACAQSGLLPEAQRLFDSAPDKNGISWNALLAGYLCNSRLDAARQIFDSNSQWELVSWNAMLAGYMRGKQTEAARELFDRMPERDVVSWNTMIAGFAQNGKLEEACKLFDITPIRDVFTWTSIVSAYSQKGMLKEARSVFDAMPERNVVSWNAMIAGYAKSRKMEEAKQLFDAMPCKNISTWNTVITGYAQSGDITSARKAFDEMPRRDSISWSAIIAAYTQGGLSEDALHMLKEMKKQGEKVNRSCFTCCLSTCADIAILDCGRQLHASLIKAGVEASSFVGNALLAMYCKCGSPDDAYDAFRDIRDKDLVSWNTMIFGYARHGFGKEALKMFGLMKETECKPDDITLVAVLSACSHSGLVDQGIEYFYTMHQNYGITAKAEHYTCMIDLLGRVGRLEEAENLMRNLPFEADATMWGALLGASRKHGNTMLGEKAAERIFEMEPDNAGMYVLLSNIYASSGKWSNVGKLRVAMRDKGVRKVPGFSWMEVMNKVHTFSVGDSLHPEINKIYSFLEELDLRLKKAGYVSSPKLVLHDVEEEEKEHMLKYHSEKLAVAYGLLKLPRGRPIRVMKNLRVCEDCHSAIKHISAIENRLIIIRDSNRFHHFHAGSCSCGDYW